MKRKVIKQANQAYTITLPIEWIRKNNINEKSELELIELDKSLIIKNTSEIEHKIKKIEVTGLNKRNVSRIIKSLYSQGIDEIELISKEKISSQISEHLHDCLGYALVNHKEDKYIIKDLGGNSNQDLDEIFKRVFQMILGFYEAAIEDIFGKEQESLEGLRSRDIEINKFCLYLQRQINKMSYKDPVKGRALFTFSFALEKIGDEIQRLWRTNIKYKIKKTDKLKKLTKESALGLDYAFEFYFQFNPDKSEKITLLRDKVREDSLELIKIDKYTARFNRHIVKIIEEAADLSHLTYMMKL